MNMIDIIHMNGLFNTNYYLKQINFRMEQTINNISKLRNKFIYLYLCIYITIIRHKNMQSLKKVKKKNERLKYYFTINKFYLCCTI